MSRSAIRESATDPTSIFEHFRGNFGSEILVAASMHFKLFSQLAECPRQRSELCEELGLGERAATVLLTALRAMNLVTVESSERFALTALSRQHLVPDEAFYVGEYFALAADNPRVLELVERLRSNCPVGADSEQGIAFIYRQGIHSAMMDDKLARQYTLSLAGRARVVAPHLAQRVPLNDAQLLVDVAGGSGIYAIALLQKNPNLRAIVLELPKVLPIAAEFAREYGVEDRLELREFDMFSGEPLPKADTILLSNVLHDWDVPDCKILVRGSADALTPGGRLLIHDVFLNDTLDGPLPIALYSVALFTLTEGRAYSAAEYKEWLTEADLAPGEVVPTLVHCGVLTGTKGAV